jgi:phosphohistidine swiveling domain-containing protein
MTRSEFAPIMKKAKSIINDVNDESSITSLTVILSLELGISCIIGTKIAT